MDQAIFDKFTEIYQKIDADAPISDEKRELYETLINMFPTYPEFWIWYIRDELNANNQDLAQKLFYRCLPIVPDVALFQHYLDYVTATCTDKQQICAAYEYALSNIGIDMDAKSIYMQYVEFAQVAGNEIVSVEHLRRLYHRALLIPMNGLNEILAHYENWEKSKSRELANKLIPEQERHFKATANVYHKKKKYHEPLKCELHSIEQGGFDSLHRWRLFIEFEKTNPLGASPEILKSYVVYAYRCALMSLQYCSILWHEYAQYLVSIDESNEAIDVYKKAIHILPKNLMLNFTYAELLESRKRSSEARELYQQLIEQSKENPSDFTLAAILYLQFLQRTEGPISMRKEFMKLMQAESCTYHLYLAMAKIENNVNVNRDAAIKIITLAAQKYGDDNSFQEKVIKRLIDMNAEKEVLTILENNQTKLSKESKLEIYKTFWKHLFYRNGDAQLLNQIKQEIETMEPTEIDKMDLMEFYLPTDFRE